VTVHGLFRRECIPVNLAIFDVVAARWCVAEDVPGRSRGHGCCNVIRFTGSEVPLNMFKYSAFKRRLRAISIELDNSCG
jgi:hypothetical protein